MSPSLVKQSSIKYEESYKKVSTSIYWFQKHLSVCDSHISRTVHLIIVILDMCIVKSLRKSSNDFGAIWTCDAFNLMKIIKNTGDQLSVVLQFRVLLTSCQALLIADQELQVTLTVSERKLRPNHSKQAGLKWAPVNPNVGKKDETNWL